MKTNRKLAGLLGALLVMPGWGLAHAAVDGDLGADGAGNGSVDTEPARADAGADGAGSAGVDIPAELPAPDVNDDDIDDGGPALVDPPMPDHGDGSSPKAPEAPDAPEAPAVPERGSGPGADGPDEGRDSRDDDRDDSPQNEGLSGEFEARGSSTVEMRDDEPHAENERHAEGRLGDADGEL